MANRERLPFAYRIELLQRIGARRFQQSVTQRVAVRFGENERLVDERREHVEDVELVESAPLPTATAPSSVNPLTKMPRRRKSTRSRSSSRSWLQSISARKVCWRGSTSRLPPVSTRKRSSSRSRKLLRAEHLHARRGKFDRKRNAVEPPADVGDDRRVLVGQFEAVVGGQRALDEKRDRRESVVSPRSAHAVVD